MTAPGHTAQAPSTAGVAVAGMPGSGAQTLRQVLLADLEGSVAAGAVGLFLVDPAAIADVEDQRLLAELRSRSAAVALVCTRIDAFWDWPGALAQSRQLLDPDHRLPVFVVSAVAASMADDSGGGIADLVDWIRQQSTLDGVRRQLLRDDSAIQSEIDSVRTDIAHDESAAIDAQRTAAAADRDRGRADRMHAVRAASGRLRARMVAEIHADSRVLVESVSHAEGTGEAFERSVRARLDEQGTRTGRRLADELAAWEASTMVGLGESGALAEESRSLRVPVPHPVPESTARREDLMVVLLGASAGLGLGRLAVAPMAAVDTLKWISMPLSLVLGFIVAVVVVRERRRSAARGRLRAWAVDAVAEHRMGLEQEVVGAIVAAEATLAGRIGRHYERNARAVGDELARIDRRLADARRHRSRSEERLAELLERRDANDRVRRGMEPIAP